MKKIPPLLAMLLLAISTSCYNNNSNSGNNTENTAVELGATAYTTNDAEPTLATQGNSPRRTIEEKIAEIKCRENIYN